MKNFPTLQPCLLLCGTPSPQGGSPQAVRAPSRPGLHALACPGLVPVHPSPYWYMAWADWGELGAILIFPSWATSRGQKTQCQAPGPAAPPPAKPRGAGAERAPERQEICCSEPKNPPFAGECLCTQANKSLVTKAGDNLRLSASSSPGKLLVGKGNSNTFFFIYLFILIGVIVRINAGYLRAQGLLISVLQVTAWLGI